ncbi:PaaI family thioesterase [Rhodococcus koreensis]|uniref:Acyl-coenzyme A thioesterase THEM4 n=1 Tax=Rhodococcus koreensis TaxID=99653 RepID=A0A1H4L322_9NOCA|nr:PaaI family thioesterase [Rhodococcus koreensis]SEB64562.1 Acyl-coenzyme A thioesterase PaaI, contains HGG motif [Rhodococcus koreensis]
MTGEFGGALPAAVEEGVGGFRTTIENTTERGGVNYGEFIEEVRTFMDRARAACPTTELNDDILSRLRAINDLLKGVTIDEWYAPSGTRTDLPARGNIMLPPYTFLDQGADGVVATLRFRRFHLGGNSAVHGGYVGLAVDEVMGLAAGLARGITRTAYLTINYRSVTPLDTDLELKAWVDRTEGRKTFLRATLSDGDRVCADAEALFILLNPGQR